MPLSLLVRPPTLARKPQWPFRLNRDSWQANGLVSWIATADRSDSVVDYVSGVTLPYFNGATTVGTPWGIGTDCSVAADAGAMAPTTAATMTDVTTTVATFFLTAVPDALGHIAGTKLFDPEAPPYAHAVVGSYGPGGAFPGSYFSDGSNPFGDTCASGASWTTYVGTLMQMAARVDPLTRGVDFWINGVSMATFSATGFPPNSWGATSQITYGMWQNGIGRNSKAIIFDARIYSRWLSDVEVAALWQPHNLWALYQPTRRFWAMGDAAAVTSGFLLVKN
jgi:hypothetical protein